MSRPLALSGALALAAPALAVPPTLTHQGRVLDAGLPLDGEHTVTLSLYDADAAATAAWSETRTLEFDDGYYAVVLGEADPLPADLFDAGRLWLGLRLGAEPELPRIEIGSAPFAVRAGTATDLRGGTVDAASITVGATTIDESGVIVNGQRVVDADGAVVAAVGWSVVTEVPPDLDDGDDDTLAALDCPEGWTLRRVAGAWACHDPAASPPAPPASATLTLDGAGPAFEVIEWSFAVEYPATIGSSQQGSGIRFDPLRLTVRATPALAAALDRLHTGQYLSGALEFDGGRLDLAQAVLSELRAAGPGLATIALGPTAVTVTAPGATPSAATWSVATQTGTLFDPAWALSPAPRPGADRALIDASQVVLVGSGGATRTRLDPATWTESWSAAAPRWLAALTSRRVHTGLTVVDAQPALRTTLALHCALVDRVRFAGAADGVTIDVATDIGARTVTFDALGASGEVSATASSTWSVMSNRADTTCP
jgi:hypothetical protein